MKEQKRYIIRKYVMATSAQDAIKKEKKLQVDDIWVDQDYEQLKDKAKIGF